MAMAGVLNYMVYTASWRAESSPVCNAHTGMKNEHNSNLAHCGHNRKDLMNRKVKNLFSTYVQP